MAKKGAPTPPDPIKTAKLQTKSNIATAVAQKNLNSDNTVTPYGSTTTKVIGKNADGTPKYETTAAFSAPMQGVFDTATKTAATPVDLSNGATEARLMELGRARLDPLLEQRRQATETDLVNRGIRPGSTAYDQAHVTADQGENDAFNQLLLTGHQQAVSDALAQHNSPINDFTALNGGATQLQTPQVGVGGTDVSGLVQSNYQQQNQNYQQGQSDLYGGLFGLGKAAIGLSDERLKTNIRDTGAEVKGVPIKTWNWKATGEPSVGVIAQELERKHPSMVDRGGPDGMRRVNYARLMRPMARAA